MANITLDHAQPVSLRLPRRLAALVRLYRVARARRASQRLIRAEMTSLRDRADIGLDPHRPDGMTGLARALGGR